MIRSSEIIEYVRSRVSGVSVHDVAVRFKGSATEENLAWAKGALTRIQRLSVEGKATCIIGYVGGKYKELYTIGDYETVLIRRAKDVRTRTENTLMIRRHLVTSKTDKLTSDKISVLNRLDEVLNVKEH